MAAESVALSIIIPCFNEAEGVQAMHERLVAVWPTLSRTGQTELILVDDGSTDATYTLLQQAFATWPNARIVRHNQNQGLGVALRTGFSYARGAIIVTCDSDGTYPFNEIPNLLARLGPDVDIVTGSPYHPEGGIENVPAYRIFLSKGASFLYRVLVDGRINTYTSMFRAYRRPVVERVQTRATGFLMVTEMLVEAMLNGFHVAEYPAVLRVRRYGQSKARVARITRTHLEYQANLLRRRLFGNSAALSSGTR
ncbi:MAG: glycosyltransferase family 2 protein [Chloroflexaceae bacterium]|jgi:dolichol-phosphate mannosyltransferase|nr:glycosyltransferase family 2 protein [Chloroflexaceae bacterium]